MATMIGRPKQYNHETVVENALDFFWSRGFAGSSLNELAGVVDLSKSSFYSIFKNKDDLFRQALILYMDRMKVEIDYLSSLDDPYKAFRHLFECTLINAPEEVIEKGCFLANSALEQYALDDSSKELILNSFENMKIVISKLIARFSKSKCPDPETIDSLANLYISQLTGLRALGRAGFSTSDLVLAIDSFLEILIKKLKTV